MELEGQFWIEEISEPFSIKNYEHHMQEEVVYPYLSLLDLNYEEFLDTLSD